jgi:hypothetical protein
MATAVRPALQRLKENYAKLNGERGPMESQMIEERKLHATLCEVERGLFHVAYRMEGTGLGKHHLPLYQLGTCASEARLLIEQQAREHGYALVVWDMVEDAPMHPTGAAAGIHLSA